MELWIRSQDKMKLVKVNYCYIRGWQDHFVIEGETFDSAPIVGEYKTKERALEVLDEIQELLKPISEYKQEVDNLTINFKNIDITTYQMPKE